MYSKSYNLTGKQMTAGPRRDENTCSGPVGISKSCEEVFF